MRVWPFLLSGLLLFGCGEDGGVDDAGQAGDSAIADGATLDSETDGAAADGRVADAFLFDGSAPTDGATTDADIPIDSAVDSGADAGPLPDYPADWPRSRGWTWVRDNTPFVTALSVRMGPPPTAAVNRYFDDFGATAVHLWQTGIPTAIGGWLDARPAAPWLSWVDLDGNSSANNLFLGGEPRIPGRIGYQVGDEPRDRPHFTRILNAMARIAEADPAPLRVFNFTYQADEIDAFLEEACAAGTTDIFSYDRYSYSNSQFTTMLKFRAAAQRCGIPYWRYLFAFLPDGSRDEVPSAADLRWDAFSGLLAGYTGHTWFLYNVEGDDEGIPTVFFDTANRWDATITEAFGHAAAINRELVAYGRAQSRLRSTAVGWYTARAIPTLHPPDDFPQWRAGMGGDRFLQRIEASGSTIQDVLLGFFEDRYRETYVIVMNPNHPLGSFPTSGSADARVTLRFDFSGASVAHDHLQVLRANGTVENVPLSANAVTFDIPPGDIVFYKYDSGRGFEGYR